MEIDNDNKFIGDNVENPELYEMPIFSEMLQRETAIQAISVELHFKRQAAKSEPFDAKMRMEPILHKQPYAANQRIETSVAEQQKAAFVLMWQLLKRIACEGKERSKLYEILLKMKEEELTGDLFPVCCVIHLQRRCEQKFQTDPDWCFKFTQELSSRLLRRVGAHIRDSLGKMLATFKAHIEVVGRTDITELIHAFDKEIDHEDLIAMAKHWTKTLITINQRRTNLHKFVVAYLRNYTIAHMPHTKAWEKLQEQVYRWQLQSS